MSRYHLDTWIRDVTGRCLLVGLPEECTDEECPYDHVVVKHVEGFNSQERRRSTPENVECQFCEGGEAWWTAIQANDCPACDGTGQAASENVEEPTVDGPT